MSMEIFNPEAIDAARSEMEADLKKRGVEYIESSETTEIKEARTFSASEIAQMIIDSEKLSPGDLIQSREVRIVSENAVLIAFRVEGKQD
ncbi:MAG: hypothetical protein V1821_03245, partial [bacterium]